MEVESDTLYTSDYGRPVNPNAAAFYWKQVQGKDELIDKVYILIKSPGQRNTEVRRPASDQDKEEYPQAWKAFQEGKEVPLNGTPIEMMTGLMPSRIAELKLNNVRTIEDLVNVPDGLLSKLGIDSLNLRQKAKAFVDKNTGEVQALKAEIEELKGLVAKLTENAKVQVTEPQPVLPKRRGRPPKIRENIGGAT